MKSDDVLKVISVNHSNHSALNNPLWKFSWQFYAQPQVAEKCLALQDQHLVNVNLICWLIWSTLLDKTCSPSDLQQCTQLITQFDQQTIMLRKIRIQLKTEITQPITQQISPQLPAHTTDNLAKRSVLRDIVKKLELLAEQYQQRLLFEQTKTFNQTKATCDSNDIGQHNLKQLLLFYQLPRPVLKTLRELLVAGQQVFDANTHTINS